MPFGRASLLKNRLSNPAVVMFNERWSLPALQKTAVSLHSYMLSIGNRLLKWLPGIQSQYFKKMHIGIKIRIRCGKQFIAGEDGVGACQETKGLAFHTHARPAR